MFRLKYYTAIEEAQKKTETAPKDALAAFDLNDLGADSLRRRFSLWTRDRLFRVALSVMRAIWPLPRFGRLVIVTRDEDVREVLNNPEAFEVPYHLEMRELGGADFVLGLEGCEHTDQRKIISSVMLQQDAARISELTAKFAKALIRSSGGRIDVMKDFITRVATETCIRYFGLTVDDPDAFAEWAMSISALLFADPFGEEKTRLLALNGSARMRAAIDRSIARQMQPSRRDDETVLGRLLKLQTDEPQLTNAKIRAILVGLVAGFIPTTTLAAGKILQQLLRRADAFDEAKTAARQASNPCTRIAGRETLQRLLFNAARHNPALAPGQWRSTSGDCDACGRHVASENSKRKLRAMVATESALRDTRRAANQPNPTGNDPSWSAIELMFGHGIPACLGVYVAKAQITACSRSCCHSRSCERGVMLWIPSVFHWVGPFPRRFDMEFEPAVPASQTMVTICAPLAADADIGAMRQTIEGGGNPATPSLRNCSTTQTLFTSLRFR